MILIVLTVIVIALTIATLAIYLFAISAPLNRIANNLGDCLQSLRTVAGQTNVIRPGIERLNKTGGELLQALPLLLEDANGVATKLAQPANPRETVTVAASAATRTSVGYMDLAPNPNPAPATGVGYLDT